MSEEAVTLKGHVSKEGDHITVYCPFCDDKHTHHWYGGGQEHREHKSAHCNLPDSPFLKHGYYVVESVREI